jgi:hypothetical protein
MLDLLKEEKKTPELPDCKIGVVHGLPALFAHDADADVGSLDHCHVIGTCASGKKSDAVPSAERPMQMRSDSRP